MNVHRLAGACVLGLSTAIVVSAPGLACGAAAEEPASTAAPLLRVFLRDGRSLVSFGEFARVGDRVVFSMPTSVSAANPQLHLVDLPTNRVDWARTESYAESARAARYLSTQAETDYALLTTDIAQALNDVALTSDPARRLAIVERARRILADWPPRHYGYKQHDVRQMLSMLDEAIAELRAATGAQRFDLALVAAVEPPTLQPLLPTPDAQETIEQALAAATMTDSPSARTSLLAAVVAAIVRDRAALPADWALATKAAAESAIAGELQTDRAYHSLTTRIVLLASGRAKQADVRGVQRVRDELERSDRVLGNKRPDVVLSLMAAVDEQLDAARRLRLARDRWAIRAPELRNYRNTVSPPLQRLLQLGPALQDIKALSGSGPDALADILRATQDLLRIAQSVTPPSELLEVHSVLLNAAQLADAAARYRREAALTGNMSRAWEASSAAAGSLLLSARAQTDMQAVLRLPQLTR